MRIALAKIMLARSYSAYRVGKLTGLPTNLIIDYAKGEKLPGATNITKLCDALGCTADELLGREPPREAS